MKINKKKWNSRIKFLSGPIVLVLGMLASVLPSLIINLDKVGTEKFQFFGIIAIFITVNVFIVIVVQLSKRESSEISKLKNTVAKAYENAIDSSKFNPNRHK